MPIKLDLVELADLTRPVDLARGVLKQIDSVAIPVPIEEIAIAAGVQEIQALSTSSIEGALIATEGSATILVNLRSPERRKRFTIGHELGHYLCPWHLLESRRFECSSQDMRAEIPRGDPRLRLEVEANMFSAEILLPESPYKRALRSAGALSLEVILDLAATYRVSKVAAGRRAATLHDDAAAMIVAHDGRFLAAYRGKTFPYLALKVNQELPRGSIAYRGGQSHDGLSEVTSVDGSHWLDDRLRPGSKLFEQCLNQAEGYQLILLTLDESDCRDDDEDYAEERSAWNPRFRR